MLNPEDRTRSCATELVCRDCGRRLPLLDTTFKCLGCGNGLDIDYDYELAKARLDEHADRRARRSTSGASRSCCRSSTPRRRPGSAATAAARR